MGNWDSYVMVEGDKQVTQFWCDADRPQGKTLLIIGEGFDPRMNNVLRAFVETKTEIDCKIIVFGDYTKSPNASMIERNIEARKTLLEKGAVSSSVYQLKIGAKKDLNRGVKLMNKEVESLINGYDNIIVDISALPKVLYFNLVRSIYKSQNNKNLFIVVSENAEIDRRIKYINLADDIEPMVKFNPGIGLEAEPDRIRIQISLLGENGMEKWNKILGHFNPDEDFPVVPYPSLDPFRTDSIIKEYKELFKQEDAKDNIIYAHERNPFELYRLLTRFIQSEDEILGKVKQMACYGIALLSSKLLSVGALLTAMENENEVAIYNVISRDYVIDKDSIDFDELNKKSTTFLMWIKGDAYND